MKRKGIKIVSYTLAAGILAGSLSLTAGAAPIAGVVGKASTDSDTVESSSYSTLAGVSLTVSNILADSSKKEIDTTVDDNGADVVETPQNEYANVAIAQVNNYVNVRSTPGEDGEVVGKLYDNSAATVQATEGDWYKITSGNVEGYVKSEFVVMGNEELARSVSKRLATVNTQTLYVRAEATTDSSVVGMVPEGDDLIVTDESMASSGWVKVSAEEGDGFVSMDYVSLSTEYTLAESKAEEEARLAREEAQRKTAAAAAARKRASTFSAAPAARDYAAPSGSGGSAVANYACQFVGNPYVYGGSSLTNGTDCSGFVMSVYGAFGVGLPHSSSALRGVGYAVGYDQMQPGDIVCYSGHVGIYIGGGTIVHASSPSTGIKYSNVNYRSILAIRRIF